MLAVFSLVCIDSAVRSQSPLKVNTVKLDCHGDPLPAGALVRLGTVRFRHADTVSFVAFLPDGKTLLTAAQDQLVHLWDLGTGKEVRRFGNAATLSENFGDTLEINGTPVSALTCSRPMQVATSAGARLLAAWDNEGIRVWHEGAGVGLNWHEEPSGMADLHRSDHLHFQGYPDALVELRRRQEVQPLETDHPAPTIFHEHNIVVRFLTNVFLTGVVKPDAQCIPFAIEKDSHFFHNSVPFLMFLV
jgi:WD40 repeat protein